MNPFLADLPLANIDIREVIGGIVTLLFLVLWVVSQVMEGKKQAGQPPARGPAPPPAGQQRPGAPQPAAKPPVAGGLRGEMEEFLRRAAGQAEAKQRGAAQRRRQPAQQDKIEVLVDDRGKPPEQRRLAEPSRPLDQRTSSPAAPATGKPILPRQPKRPLAPRRETVAEHVSQHISTAAGTIGEQASQLGKRIVQDDEQFDVQLKAKFDREVGTLGSSRVTDTPSQSPDHRDATSPAGQLAAMLANPDGVRQAIILNEVLRRPSERW